LKFLALVAYSLEALLVRISGGQREFASKIKERGGPMDDQVVDAPAVYLDCGTKRVLACALE